MKKNSDITEKEDNTVQNCELVIYSKEGLNSKVKEVLSSTAFEQDKIEEKMNEITYAFLVACKKGNHQIVEIIQQYLEAYNATFSYEAKEIGLFKASVAGRTSVVTLLLSQSEEKNSTIYEVKIILDCIIDTFIQVKRQMQCKELYTGNDRFEVMSLLLKYLIKISKQNASTSNAQMDLSTIQDLEISTLANNFSKILIFAAKLGKEEIVDLLLQCIEILIPSLSKDKAMTKAIEHGHKQVVSLIYPYLSTTSKLALAFLAVSQELHELSGNDHVNIIATQNNNALTTQVNLSPTSSTAVTENKNDKNKSMSL